MWEPGGYYVYTVNDIAYAPAPRPTIRFVTSPSKDDVQVNQVDLNPNTTDPDDAWPDNEVMAGKVKTQSATRRKDASHGSSKRDKTRHPSSPKANASTPEDRRPKTSAPSAQQNRPLIEE
ncbi:hypothetical protein AXG93_3667s1030 [Marchantia polymorpha subsp. ruderalis]|uniref:Uncharacterized protein n=1 Tax=Marchantia polymorpha subsp. ruderalis TaxID=1480154 RepID=A0A176VZP3_MARPO|nr:hypothetical protein AXG93_3667s1030 [Marchantia polymorpha subsp. ruderalis]